MNPDQLFKDMLREGGYGKGGLLLTLQLKSLQDKNVVVTDAHIVNERCDIRATDPIVFATGTVRPIPRFGFDLDAVPSTARIIERENGNEQFGAEYFSLEKIGLRFGAVENLIISFKVGQQACSFNLALDYQVDGEQRPTVYVQKSLQDNAPLQLNVTG